MNKATQDLVARYRDLFRCRENAFAVGVKRPDGNKYAYPPERNARGEDIPLDDDYVYRHLRGDIIIGVYPLFDESKTSWAALDFDGGDGFTEDPVKAAFAQKNRFSELGLFSYVEISQSGNGAHLWLFLDAPIEARDIRKVVRTHVLKSETYDRMFPNQDTAKDKYGNLIALPYFGEAYKRGHSAFITEDGELIPPGKFIETVRRNSASFVEALASSITDEKPRTVRTTTGTHETSPRGVPGAVKVVKFCKWMQAARERMHRQNQEPEFYALCCQFAQLEDGERLAYEYGRLHPYTDERIKQKFEQAKATNKPHSCRTLREEFGYECTCDIDYGVEHCYELGRKSFQDLLSARKGDVLQFNDMAPMVIDRAELLMNSHTRFGWPLGYNFLDDLTALRKGNLIILAARTGVGKTSFAIDVSANLNNVGVPVYWASLEMTYDEILLKYLGRQTGIDSRLILEGTLNSKDLAVLREFHNTNTGLPLFVDDVTKDVDKMLDIFSAAISKYGPGLIIVDYIELIRPRRGESMQDLTARAAVELKGMAKALEVPVMALSNFNRKAEQDQIDGVEVQDSWLRNSGLLEQTADVILYLLGKKGSQPIIKRTMHIQKERFTGKAGEEVFMWHEQALSKFHTKNPGSESGRIEIAQAFLDGELGALEMLE